MFEYNEKLAVNPIFTFETVENKSNNITMFTGATEMLRVAEDGFYVRGVKVAADENEAQAVYRAFKQWLVHHALTREY